MSCGPVGDVYVKGSTLLREDEGLGDQDAEEVAHGEVARHKVVLGPLTDTESDATSSDGDGYVVIRDTLTSSPLTEDGESRLATPSFRV